MAEIHALLYVSTEPVCTDDVMSLLQVSRGNASMNLRSLVDWGLIERSHVRGDRKVDYGTVMRVMGRLSAAGFRRVALVTEVEQGT